MKTKTKTAAAAQTAIDTEPRAAAKPASIVELSLDQIRPSPTNPRKHFDQARLDELAESVRLHGVIQPVLARPLGKFSLKDGATVELVAGERRWLAANSAGLVTLPVIVRELTDQQVL